MITIKELVKEIEEVENVPEFTGKNWEFECKRCKVPVYLKKHSLCENCNGGKVETMKEVLELIKKKQEKILEKENMGDGKNKYKWEMLEELKEEIIGK